MLEEHLGLIVFAWIVCGSVVGAMILSAAGR